MRDAIGGHAATCARARRGHATALSTGQCPLRLVLLLVPALHSLLAQRVSATGSAPRKFDDDAATLPPPNLGHPAASQLVLPPCVAGFCRSYSFDEAEYHVVNSGDEARFPRKDTHIVNGTLPPGGGDISLHSANGTFPDTKIHFGPAQNVTKYLTHTRNMSTTLAGKRFHGRAVFIDSPKANVHEMEQMLWYTPPPIAPGIDPIVGEVIIGPNPLAPPGQEAFEAVPLAVPGGGSGAGGYSVSTAHFRLSLHANGSVAHFLELGPGGAPARDHAAAPPRPVRMTSLPCLSLLYNTEYFTTRMCSVRSHRASPTAAAARRGS